MTVVVDSWMGQLITTDTTLVVEVCPTCHIHHAIPRTLRDKAIEHHAGHRRTIFISCPIGHEWRYGAPAVSDADRLLEERERSAALRARLEQSEASRRAHKGAATRARRERDRITHRVKAGVCPCCGRTFKQLARHMASQHPDWDHADDTPQEA